MTYTYLIFREIISRFFCSDNRFLYLRVIKRRYKPCIGEYYVGMLAEESKIKWVEFRSGSKEAYSWIYRTYIQVLYRYGLRFTSDEELIKDSIQEVFTYIYKNRNQLTDPANVRVYLFIALKNNLLRAVQKESMYDISDTEAIPFSLEPTVEDRFIEKEQSELQNARVKEMLSFLTPRQQEIIYYRYIQELSFDEICQLMDLNYQSAQNLIQRSLKKMRDIYGPTTPLFFFLSCLSY